MCDRISARMNLVVVFFLLLTTRLRAALDYLLFSSVHSSLRVRQVARLFDRGEGKLAKAQ